MSTGSISLDILLNKILTDAISGGNESIRAIQKRYPSLSEKEAHYLDVISDVYGINQSKFIRLAILEKLKRDVPKLRENKKKEVLPF